MGVPLGKLGSNQVQFRLQWLLRKGNNRSLRALKTWNFANTWKAARDSPSPLRWVSHFYGLATWWNTQTRLIPAYEHHRICKFGSAGSKD